MNKTKVTDIFCFSQNQEISLEYIEQLFLQALEENKVFLEIPNSNMILHLKTPPEKLINFVQKRGINELIAENKHIGYINDNHILFAIVAYIKGE